MPELSEHPNANVAVRQGGLFEDTLRAVGPILEFRNRESSLDGCRERQEFCAPLQTPQPKWLIATIEYTEDDS